MNTQLFFGNSSDERATPQGFFNSLNAEFKFDLDAAATQHNRKCELYFGPGGVAENALIEEWGGLGATVFVNPPYSNAGAFIEKARTEAEKGAVVVMLLPVRSDTQWWHRYIWDRGVNDFRTGVECRLLMGRLSFELHVPMDIRAWVKSEMALVNGKEATDKVKAISTVTGVPPMAIERICQDLPDEQLMEAAPFPSCVVIFKVSGSELPVLNAKKNRRGTR